LPIGSGTSNAAASYDPHSRNTTSDAKFGISTWMDLEDAVDYFAAREAPSKTPPRCSTVAAEHGEGEAPGQPAALWAEGAQPLTETYIASRQWHVCLASKAGFRRRSPPATSTKGRDIRSC
jgi:hypothetical protein